MNINAAFQNIQDLLDAAVEERTMAQNRRDATAGDVYMYLQNDIRANYWDGKAVAFKEVLALLEARMQRRK